MNTNCWINKIILHDFSYRYVGGIAELNCTESTRYLFLFLWETYIKNISFPLIHYSHYFILSDKLQNFLRENGSIINTDNDNTIIAINLFWTKGEGSLSLNVAEKGNKHNTSKYQFFLSKTNTSKLLSKYLQTKY